MVYNFRNKNIYWVRSGWRYLFIKYKETIGKPKLSPKLPKKPLPMSKPFNLNKIIIHI